MQFCCQATFSSQDLFILPHLEHFVAKMSFSQEGENEGHRLKQTFEILGSPGSLYIEKKLSTQRDLTSQPFCYEACTLPLPKEETETTF